MNNLPKIYAFDNFRFDADKFVLYCDNVLVKTGDKKTMQVLAVLLLAPNKLTTHDEIIEKVWEDNPHGVTSNHIGQYIRRLRKVFAEYAPSQDYIETVKGRGYLFVGEVKQNGKQTPPEAEESAFGKLSALPPAAQKSEKTPAVSKTLKATIACLILLSILLVVVLSRERFSGNNEKEIKHVVKESQLYESLVIYKNPSAFNEESLDKYWTSEFDLTESYDRQRIREAVRKMNEEGRRYGNETRCEQFDFQSVEINQSKDFAVVKTLEKWFIASYFNDGSLQKNKYVGPYFVSYILRKVDGKWLIEKSSTARVNPPAPRLSAVEKIAEAKSKEQFFVKITGQDFQPETVYVEVVGEGCPEAKPCKVPNEVLRENSKMTETVLENVPLTLASGDFRIVVRNGTSPPSNPQQVNVP